MLRSKLTLLPSFNPEHILKKKGEEKGKSPKSLFNSRDEAI